MRGETHAGPQAGRPRAAVALLGGFAATVDGEAQTQARWRLRKGRELVKLLALAPGHRLHREQLMEALWPEREPAAAANNLHQAVHAARRVLGAGAIVVREEMLTLHARVDLDDFERAAVQARRSGSPAAVRAALALHTGELLPENRYDDWAAEARERVEEAREELQRLLGAHARAQRIGALPAPASSFVGREHELHELATLLGRTRLLTLAGPGGAGKTRLALELARQREDDYEHGVALVELASVREGALVAAAAAAALELTPAPGRSAAEAIAEHLAGRHALLVLDNCEHVLAHTADLCDALLRVSPGVRVLATSREPLRLAGELVFRVPSLGLPDPARFAGAGELARYEAVRLFTERAAAAAGGFTLDAENAADVARICFRLDGLPLALELAAARLTGLGTRALCERLDDRFRLLRGGAHDAPTRQQTLRATLEWSHELLRADERLLLRRIAVFSGGFDLRGAECVCADETLAAASIADVLGRLVEKSLVVAERSGTDLRYRLLETVRMFAHEQLRRAGESEAVAAAHAAWALALASREADSALLDRESANLRAAHAAMEGEQSLRYCLALLPFWLRRIDLEEAHRRFHTALAAAPEPTPLRAQVLLAASAIEYRAGALARADALAQQSLEIASELSLAPLRWRALQRLGEIAVAHDDTHAARRGFERAHAFARREGLHPAQAISLYSLGVTCWLAGDLAGAEERLARSAAALHAAERSGETVLSPLNISEMRSSQRGGGAGLRIDFEETLQPFTEISAGAAVSHITANRATLARLGGEPARARMLLDEAAARFERAEDGRGRAAVLARRAYLELAEGEADEARRCFEQALQIRRELADRRGVGLALAGLAVSAMAAGEHRLAEEQLAEARELFRRAGDRWGLISTLWRSAELATARGEAERARALLGEAGAVAGETERRSWIDVTLAMQAELAGSTGRTEDARTLLVRAREGYAAAADEAALQTIDERLRSLAEDRQSRRKGAPRTTVLANPKDERRNT